MADNSSEKTEKATPKKLRDARKKGQVASSKDLPPAFIMIVAAIYFWVAGAWLLEKLMEVFIALPQLQHISFGEALSNSVDIIIKVVIVTMLLPFILLMAIMAILGNIIQFGFVFSVDPVIPKLKKINPAEGFKRIFSIKQFVNTVFSLVKTIAIAAALFFIIWLGLGELLNEIKQCNVICQTSIIADLFKWLMIIILPLMFFMSILDFIFQKQQFDKEQRMTKEEVKREMKEIFGDPTIRGARDSMRREMNEQDIKARIKTARLLVVDIGLAVALHYEQDVTPLPLIVAIGKDAMARKMVEIAQIEDVAIVSDARLTEDLVEDGKIDQYIPTSTIDRVARAMRKTSR